MMTCGWNHFESIKDKSILLMSSNWSIIDNSKWLMIFVNIFQRKNEWQISCSNIFHREQLSTKSSGHHQDLSHFLFIDNILRLFIKNYSSLHLGQQKGSRDRDRSLDIWDFNFVRTDLTNITIMWFSIQSAETRKQIESVHYCRLLRIPIENTK